MNYEESIEKLFYFISENLEKGNFKVKKVNDAFYELKLVFNFPKSIIIEYYSFYNEINIKKRNLFFNKNIVTCNSKSWLSEEFRIFALNYFKEKEKAEKLKKKNEVVTAYENPTKTR